MLRNVLTSAGLVLVGAASLPTSASAATTLIIDGGTAQVLESLEITVNGSATTVRAFTGSSGDPAPTTPEEPAPTTPEEPAPTTPEEPAPGGDTGACGDTSAIPELSLHNSSNQRLDLGKDNIVSFKLVTNSSTTAKGQINTAYTTTNPTTRTTWISSCPGDLTPLASRCIREGTEASSMTWGQFDGRLCELAPQGQVYYLNVKNAPGSNLTLSTCPSGNCPFILDVAPLNP